MDQAYDVKRRRYVRITPNPVHPVRVDINGVDFIDVFKVVDISQGGLAVQVPHGFNGCNIDQLVSFVLDLPEPDHKLIHGTGKIRRISGNIFGMSYVTLSSNVTGHIRNYIALQLKRDSWWRWLGFKLGYLD